MKNIFIYLVAILLISSVFADEDLSIQLIHEAEKEVGFISSQDLKKLIDSEANVIVLDVREAYQKVDGAIYSDESYAITRGDLEFLIMSKIKNKNALIVTYCRGGHRSALAALSLRHIGYKNATTLKGGIRAWAKSGYPIETKIGITRLVKAY
ncbi:MAG: rhodanese-like domain-containing protein [Sulfurimonas sp.]|nr:rhodanese-like domain-containing protein [Sulfurimonas sp.]MDQ7059948.1 rhodanese-like domain-containing protein [Sulfurimonas sp.]